MEGRLEARMKEMVEQLAREHQQELAAAGTLLDLEELTCQIGDEFTRLLTEKELVRRGEEHRQQAADCPDCGRSCPPHLEPEPVTLIGLRGEVAYRQPKHFCDRCRRSFFPAVGPTGDSVAEPRHAPGAAEDRVGRRQQRQLRTGRRGAR